MSHCIHPIRCAMALRMLYGVQQDAVHSGGWGIHRNGGAEEGHTAAWCHTSPSAPGLALTVGKQTPRTGVVTFEGSLACTPEGVSIRREKHTSRRCALKLNGMKPIPFGQPGPCGAKERAETQSEKGGGGSSACRKGCAIPLHAEMCNGPVHREGCTVAMHTGGVFPHGAQVLEPFYCLRQGTSESAQKTAHPPMGTLPETPENHGLQRSFWLKTRRERLQIDRK